MGPKRGLECDGVNDCDAICNLADEMGLNATGMLQCYNDEDPARCSKCPKAYGYPKRAPQEVWSASYLCHKTGNVTERCAIPCNGVPECPGK